jgi:hypothetical protein
MKNRDLFRHGISLVTEFRQISMFLLDGFGCIFPVLILRKKIPLADDKVD